MSFRTGVVGLGYWGPNLARNFAAHKDFQLAALCDSDATRLTSFTSLYPAARPYSKLSDMLDDGSLDLVAIATPVATHCALATAALEAGCHVLVEKPLAQSVAEAEALVRLAKDRGKHLFVDHTFVFTSAVAEIRRQIESGALGELYFVDSVRISLGLFQPDVDVVWDLAPHDLAILQHVLGRPITSVRALASSHNPRGTPDVAYLHFEYGDGLAAHLHVSWLSPVKVRRMIFAGSRQSIIYDDLEPAEKIKIYNHGVDFDFNDPETRREVLVSYRRGDMRAPALAASEALAVEVSNISETLRDRARPLATGSDGLAILRTLEAAGRSLAAAGSAVPLA